MRKHAFMLVLGVLLLSAPLRAEEDGETALLGTDGKFAAIDWASEEQAAKPAEVSLSPDASGLYGALLFLLGLGGAGSALVWYVKNRKQGGVESTARLEVIERLSLGARRELMLVRAGERLLVLASLQQDVKLIAAITDPELPEGVETDLESLLQTRAVEQAPARFDREVDDACATPSLMIDWPAGPVRG